MRTRLSRLALPLILSLSVACSSSSDDGPTDSPTPDAAGAVSDVVGTDSAGSSVDTDAPQDAVSSDGDEDVITGPGGGDESITSCEGSLPEPQGGTCEVVSSGQGGLLIHGTLVLPSGLLDGGAVLVSPTGTISCAGCDCAELVEAAQATELNCGSAVISPGLINAHDHITFTEMTPVGHGTERYDHRHEWRKGQNGKTKLPAIQNSHALGDAWGEMRQAMSGTTSLFGSGGEDGFLRNLDKPFLLEGITHDAGDYSTFPLGDSDGTTSVSGCDAYDFDNPSTAANQIAYVPHVAEGINDAARNEFHCMTGIPDGGTDLLFEHSAYIHGIGLTTADIALMAGEGAALIWSPRSNTDLYGMTADLPVYERLGALIALGTDWTASGSVNMLRELACADSWNSEYWNKHFSDAELVKMATSSAAEALGFSDQLGSLVQGKQADIVVWNASEHSGYRAILNAEVNTVSLVLRGGTPLYGDGQLVNALVGQGECESLNVCGASKSICTPRELNTTVAQLQSELDNTTYGLFFCGVPDDEPSCVPLRPGEFTGVASADDPDGDGVIGAADNCPDVFNPPRPMDGFNQTDVDEDGQGDVCDVCPLEANVSACSSVDPEDVDGDGVPNPVDNCSGLANPDQEDADSDGRGDDCDPCPSFANPGGGGCPTSIYDIKQAIVGTGEAAAILDVVVTATGEKEFFVTVPTDHEDYDGPEYGSLFVYNPGADVQPQVGDRVTINGQVKDFYGQTQLAASQVEILASGTAVPEPVVVLPGALVIGGDSAEEFEAGLVRVDEVFVTSIAPEGEDGETVSNEFEVTSGLPVDDALYLVNPFPVLGQAFSSITGVLRFSWNRNKLLPRGGQDVVFGEVELGSFGPDGAYIYEGQTGLSSPPISVALNGPAGDDTVVSISSSDPSVLEVVDGGVEFDEGDMSAVVALEALAPGGPVTLTATFKDIELTTTVTVLSLDTVPNVQEISPEELTLSVETTGTLTVSIDVPAGPEGQLITLSSSDPSVSVPNSVSVEPGETSATFEVEAGASEGLALVTASIGESSVEAEVEVSALAVTGLVLAEVLYDVSGSDTGQEWIKLYNGSPETIELSGWSIGYGGDDYTWGTYQLSGQLAPWSCIVVGGPQSVEGNGLPSYGLEQDFNPDIQNSGSNADGIALFNLAASAITANSVPVDVVIYGDANSNGLIGTDGVAAAETSVGAAGANKSLVRTGADSWDVNDTPSPDLCVPLQ